MCDVACSDFLGHPIALINNFLPRLFPLTDFRLFEYFILLTIAANCIVLMIATPLPNDDISELNLRLVSFSITVKALLSLQGDLFNFGPSKGGLIERGLLREGGLLKKIQVIFVVALQLFYLIFCKINIQCYDSLKFTSRLCS